MMKYPFWKLQESSIRILAVMGSGSGGTTQYYLEQGRGYQGRKRQSELDPPATSKTQGKYCGAGVSFTRLFAIGEWKAEESLG